MKTKQAPSQRNILSSFNQGSQVPLGKISLIGLSLLALLLIFFFQIFMRNDLAKGLDPAALLSRLVHYPLLEDAKDLDTTISIDDELAVLETDMSTAEDSESALEADLDMIDAVEYPRLFSEKDADGDGIDDFTDIMLGARAWVETEPFYDSTYYAGGYPPDEIGVCTDVIWHAFFAAGYDFKALIDADIDANREIYQIEHRDHNIDFRHTGNVQIFFERFAESLTLDVTDTAAWQAGDIVTYTGHIGIVSDKRNAEGVPYIIHQTRVQENSYEIDRLVDAEADDGGVITGHFRWHG